MAFRAVLGDLDWKIFFVAKWLFSLEKNPWIIFEKLNRILHLQCTSYKF